MTITHPTCQSCRYYQKPNTTGPIDLRQLPPGECHYGPVTVHVVPMPQPNGQFGLQNISVWPPIHGHQWCGRHQDFEKQFSDERVVLDDETFERLANGPKAEDAA